jgi:hypothetical protein
MGGDAAGGVVLGGVLTAGVEGLASGELEACWLGGVQATETRTSATIVAKNQPPPLVTRTTFALQSVSALWGI